MLTKNILYMFYAIIVTITIMAIRQCFDLFIMLYCIFIICTFVGYSSASGIRLPTLFLTFSFLWRGSCPFLAWFRP